MRIMIRDLIILLSILFAWAISLIYCSINNLTKAYEAVLAFPGHLLISVGYYAAVNVCYSILFISDCEKEYDEIQQDLAEGKAFFEKKGIKYN